VLEWLLRICCRIMSLSGLLEYDVDITMKHKMSAEELPTPAKVVPLRGRSISPKSKLVNDFVSSGMSV
jgi:hypothetical protein